MKESHSIVALSGHISGWIVAGMVLGMSSLGHAGMLVLEDKFGGPDFTHPVAMLQAPGDSTSWYVVEQPGRVIRLNANGQRSEYINISDRVEAGPNEAGLLGMAFHPLFANNGTVFLSYTRTGKPLVSIVSRFLLDKSAHRLRMDSEQVILSVDQPYRNHNGGQIGFDPAGYLLLGLGDGGSGGDPQGNGQNPKTWLGAMLRLDVDHGKPYTIPKDNPFADGKGGAPEVYAYGLRNPWRWSFDRLTGELWVADVGQNKWEEVDRVHAGGNYGWNAREGRHCYNAEPCEQAGLIDPVVEYSHAEGCSITGGYVYRGTELADLIGRYLYADFCSGRIWALKENTDHTYHPELMLESGLNISSFAEDNAGELYVLDYGNGRVLRLTVGKH